MANFKRRKPRRIRFCLWSSRCSHCQDRIVGNSAVRLPASDRRRIAAAEATGA